MAHPSSQPTPAPSARGCYDCEATIVTGEPHHAGVPLPNGASVYLCPACHAKRFPATALVQPDSAGFMRKLMSESPLYGGQPEPDPVDHPPHYKSGGIEAIDVIEAFDLGFCLGNTVKYVLRAGRKGDAVTDLKKARWYLEREIARIEGAS